MKKGKSWTGYNNIRDTRVLGSLSNTTGCKLFAEYILFFHTKPLPFTSMLMSSYCEKLEYKYWVDLFLIVLPNCLSDRDVTQLGGNI